MKSRTYPSRKRPESAESRKPYETQAKICEIPTKIVDSQLFDEKVISAQMLT